MYNPSHDSGRENIYIEDMNFIKSSLTASRWPWFALLLSGGLLCGAWFFEYVLGYAPCQMCYWQRDAHKAVILVSVLALILNFKSFGNPKVWAGLIGLAFLVSAGVAFWHMGVEFKWWEGPKTCVTGTPELGGLSGDDLLASLDAPMKLPGCSEAAWHFLGLSMAGWNMITSLGGAVLSFISARNPNV